MTSSLLFQYTRESEVIREKKHWEDVVDDTIGYIKAGQLHPQGRITSLIYEMP